MSDNAQEEKPTPTSLGTKLLEVRAICKSATADGGNLYLSAKALQGATFEKCKNLIANIAEELDFIERAAIDMLEINRFYEYFHNSEGLFTEQESQEIRVIHSIARDLNKDLNTYKSRVSSLENIRSVSNV